MLRMLGVAVTAVALSFAGQASAAITIDFEDGHVGPPYPEGASYSSGTAVSSSLGTHLQLAEKGGPFSTFSVGGWGKFQDGPRQFIWSPKLVSFDLFLPTGGTIDYLGRPETRTSIQAGEWTTITFPLLNYSSEYDCRYGCKFFINGSGALVDNVVLELGRSAIPEPATWAMMIIGFGAVGSMVRTSRRRDAFSAA